MRLYVAETHQSYLFIMLYYIFAYLLSVTITNVLVCTQSEEQLDLKAPREQKARMTGITKRAHSAHQNLLEGYPNFIPYRLAQSLVFPHSWPR